MQIRTIPCLLISCLSVLPACRQPLTSDTFGPAERSEDGAQVDLKQALEFLNRMDEFDTTQAQRKILYHLQQWLRGQQPHPDWIADPLATRLPTQYRRLASVDQLARMDLEIFDVQMLQEAMWLRDLSRSIIGHNDVPPDVRQWIEATTEGMEQGDADDLATAVVLFDWTVRNLQLDDDTQPRFGGLSLYAWESLLMGRGSTFEKSRVFILLGRQLGLEIVMLGIEEDSDMEPRTWLPALLLQKQLYLLDMRLGLPVFRADGRSIATLRQVTEQHALIRAMDVPGHRYPISEKDLRGVVGLLDATPAYMSQRMRIIEGALMGDNKTVLTVSPSPVAASLRSCRGINRVQLWTAPYVTFAQRSALRQESQANAEAVRRLAAEHGLFDRRTPLAQGRILQLRGQFDSRNEVPGARTHFLQCRTPNANIESLSELQLQTSDGLKQPTTEQLRAHKMGIAALQDLLIRTKQNATYWLALMAFDRGQYQVAIDFLQKRLLDVFDDGVWTAGARFNLGRAYEAKGLRDADPEQLGMAKENYESVAGSAQVPGSLLRARMVAERLKSIGDGTE